MEKTSEKYFNTDDIDLMEEALSLCPDLDIVTYLAKIGRGRLEYPIKDYNGLLPLLDKESNSVVFKDNAYTIEQAKQFLPEAFFPIEGETDLLYKLFIAFKIGRQSHAQNQPYIYEKFPPEAIMFRPSPSATTFK